MKPIYIIIGIPGAGKNTQGVMLAKELGFAHVDAGETFDEIIKRRVEPYWSLIQETYTNGQPIPSEQFIDIIRGRLQRDDCMDGVVLTQNTKSVDEIQMMLIMFKSLGFELRQVFSLEIPRDVAIQRNIARKMNQESIKDQDIDTLTARIDNYVRIYPSIRDFYAQKNILTPIDGELSKDEVFQKILESLNIVHG